MDAIYLAVGGEQKGPYTLAQIRESLSTGAIPRDTLAWYEGLPEWTPLFKIPEVSAGSPVPPPSPLNPASATTPAGEFTRDELRDICKKQNLLMWSVLAGFAAFFIAKIPAFGLLIVLGIVAFQIYALYTLGTSLRMPLVWLYCVGLFIPIVALIILLVVSGKASKVLGAAGVRIGIMGGRIEDLKD